MTLGIPVPQVYIVPAERFCREMGPALGVNLAEFEFPAYFNFFIYKKRCTLVVDSQEAEDNICRVFNETLLGPAQFRRERDPVAYEEEDFAPNFPREAIPDLEKELRYFRIMPDGKELAVDLLLDFSQFNQPEEGSCHENLGVPPNINNKDVEDDDEMDEEELDEALEIVGDEEVGEEEEVPADAHGVEKRADDLRWSYKKARWVGKCESSLLLKNKLFVVYLRCQRFQAMLLLCGRQMQPTSRSEIEQYHELKFLKCRVVPNISYTTLISTI